MKRISGIAVLLVASTFLLLVLVLRSPDPYAPQLRRLQAPPSFQSSPTISYDFLSPRPFASNEMLIHAASNRTNFETFLYDIEDKQIVGQLINGSPVTLIDRSKLLCVESVYAWSPLKERLVRLVGRISGGRIRLPRPSSQIQRYWLLDLEKHSASRMGDLPQRPHVTFQPSPDLSYGYTSLQGQGLEQGVYCFDFKRRSIRKLDHLHGWPSGWWDQRNIMVLATNNDIVLHDVTTEKTSPLIASERIATFLRDNMIPEDPAKTRAFFIWNGRENDFYLTDTHQRWLAAESFLIKVERPDGRLMLLASRFKFEWSDHFDPTGRYYLYSGREAGSASDGVFLRDIQSGTNRTVVMPNGNTYFSLPRFYGDSIIYVRSNRLWRINFDGTKNVQLFPP